MPNTPIEGTSDTSPGANTPATGSLRASRQVARRSFVWPFLLAIACVGTVHPPTALLVSLLIVGVQAHLLWVTRRDVKQAAPWAPLLPLVALWFVSLLTLVPVGPSLRALFQPGLAEVVDGSLALADANLHPLAVDPAATMISLGWGAALISMSIGITFAVRRTQSAAITLGQYVYVGSVLTVLAIVMLLSSAQTVLWLTDFGSGNLVPPFGTFINPNHGGALVAALVPVALSLGFTTRLERRRVWWGLAILLCAGAIASRSRGAVVDVFVGVWLWFFLISALRVRLGLLAVLVVGSVGVALFGPQRASLVVSTTIDPDFIGSDVFTGRTTGWWDGLDLIRDAPLLGVGFGGVSDAFTTTKTSPRVVQLTHLHQDWLEYAAETGLVGVVLLGSCFAWLGWRAWVTWREQPQRQAALAMTLASLAVIATDAFWFFPMRSGAIGVLAAVLIGCLTGLVASPKGWMVPRLITGGFAVVAPLFIGAGILLESTTTPATVEEARSALATRPLDHRALAQLVRHLGAQGETQEAQEALEQLVRVHPSLPAAHVQLARLATSHGDVDTATQQYRAALALDLSRTNAETLFAEALTPMGGALAMEHQLPERWDRRCQAASWLSRRGYWTDARDLYEGYPEDDVYCVYLHTYDMHMQGQTEEALARLNQVPEGCGRSRQSGTFLVALGRYKEALQALDQAKRRCTQITQSMRTDIGLARAGLGDPAGFPILEQTLQGSPNNHNVRHFLALRYREASELQKAHEHFEYLFLAGALRTEDVATYEQLDAFVNKRTIPFGTPP